MTAVTAAQEREFNKKNAEAQKEYYLSIDTVLRYKSDKVYREKIDLVEGFLKKHSCGGYILDVGANTAGESELLYHGGYKVVAVDINEIALSYSKKRAKKFRDEEPIYFAADIHRLSFADNTFDSVISFEVLHHLEDVGGGISEIYRVLRPGGYLYAYEPTSYNSYAWLTSYIGKLRGGIEKRFLIGGLSKLLEKKGFVITDVRRHFLRRTEKKMSEHGRLRNIARRVYYKFAEILLPVFGSVIVIAQKPHDTACENADMSEIESRLICPVTGSPLNFNDGRYVSTNRSGKRYSYPIYDGIPVLIKEDARESGG